MPNLQSQSTLFRQSNYHYTGYLGTIPQTIIASRAVNMTSITYPVTQITFDDAYSGVGNTANVQEGMTIRVFNGNSTELKGILRVASGGVSGSEINVNEFSRGYLDLADDDKFDVVDEFRIWDKLVSNDGDFNKDSRIAYTDQTDLYAPVANGGGAWFGHVDDGETFATVQFDATTSFTIDPDSAGTLTYLWAVDDGTITVGSTTTSTITATFPAGFRHVTLTVTDSSNSKTATTRIPVGVYDFGSTPALSIIANTLNLTTEGGADMEFRLPLGTEGSIATLPDGAPVYYWEDESYNDTPANYGSNAPVGRNHMKFVGFLDADTLQYDAFTDEVVFRAVSPLRVLEQTAALPQLLINTSSPDEWLEGSDVTVKIFIWYLLTFGASSFFDFVYDDTRTFAQARISVNESSSIAGQLREIANAVNAQITCDRLARLMFVRNPAYMSASERNAKTTAYAFTTDDTLSYSIPRNHNRRTKFVRGEGIIAASTVAAQSAVFSNAPGNAYGRGNGSDTLSGQIVSSQTDINERTGNRYGEVNGVYWNETTKQIESVPQGATLRLPDGYDVFDPAYREYVTLTLSGTRRGVAYTSSNRFLVDAVSVAYEAETGRKSVDLTISHETHAPAGVTYVPPTREENGLPPFDPVDFDFDFDLPPLEIADYFGLNPGTAEMAILTSQLANGRFLTSDFGTQSFQGGPTYDNINDAGTYSSAVSVQDLSRVLFIEGNNQSGNSIGEYADIHDPSDVPTTIHTIPQTRTPGGGNVMQRRIHHNIASPDYWQVISTFNNYGSGDGVWETHSTDNGATWSTETQLSTFSNSTTQPGITGLPMVSICEVSPVEALTAYTCVVTADSNTAPCNILKTTNGGTSWSIFQSSAALGTVGDIHVDLEGVVWWGGFGTGTMVLHNSINGTSTNLAPIVDGKRWGAYMPKSISSAITPSGTKIVVFGGTDSTISDNYYFISADNGATWTRFLVAGVDGSPRNVQVSGDGSLVYVLSNQNGVWVGSTSALLSGGAPDNRFANTTLPPNIFVSAIYGGSGA